MTIFPSGSVTTITDGITGPILANIAVVLGVVAFVVGLRYIFKMFNKGLHGKV